LGYYYLLRLNDLGEAVRAAEWIENRLQLARTFDDLGALPRAILSGDDSHLVRMLIARSADLAAEPRLPSAAVPYLIAVLEHFLASSKYTDDADLAPMMAILEAYLALDETRGDVGWTTRSTVSQSGSSQAAMGKLPVDGTQLKAQLEAVEMQLAAARAQQSHPSIIQALTRMREKRLAELREARGEPIPFPSPNGYLDSPKFQLLQQFAQRAIRLRRHSELVERLSEKGKSQLGSAPLRYQIAAAFTLWWTGDKAAAVARLEALCRQHEQDEILDVTLAHAYYSQQDLRRALAIVERMKNPDPSVAQAVANLRREIRHYYSDLAKLRDLKGHTHVVRSIAFSPDGASLLSGSYDRSLKIWEVKSGKCLQSLTGHTDLVLSVAWSPTGQRIASGSYDEIRIWDVASARCLHAIKSAGAVRSLAFSPDGQRLAAAGDDQTVRLWNVETGGEAASLAGHAERVFGIAFSPDGKMLASASGDKTVRLWNAASGQLIDTLTGHSASISCLAFAPDGRWLATGSDDNNVMLWRIGENQAYATLERHADAIYAVAFSPDGKRLASGGADRSIKLWTLGGDGEPATLLGHHNTVASLAFSPDGKALASSGYDEMVKLWTLSAMPGNEQAQAADPSPTAK
jgi:Tol biopolymer transport system component